MLSILTGALLATPSLMADDECLKMKLKDGEVYIKLRSDIAPNHVKQVKTLTEKGEYNNVVFHRVIEGYIAQTGDVEFGKKDSKKFNLKLAGKGVSELPNLDAELSNEFFDRGTVAMDHTINQTDWTQKKIENSQFFICLQPAMGLHKQYTSFGKVIKGMKYVEKIKEGDINNNNAVKDPDVIMEMTVEKCPSEEG